MRPKNRARLRGFADPSAFDRYRARNLSKPVLSFKYVILLQVKKITSIVLLEK